MNCQARFPKTISLETVFSRCMAVCRSCRRQCWTGVAVIVLENGKLIECMRRFLTFQGCALFWANGRAFGPWERTTAPSVHREVPGTRTDFGRLGSSCRGHLAGTKAGKTLCPRGLPVAATVARSRKFPPTAKCQKIIIPTPYPATLSINPPRIFLQKATAPGRLIVSLEDLYACILSAPKRSVESVRWCRRRGRSRLP